MATTSYSGGEISQGGAISGTEVWTREPPPTHEYQLLVKHPDGPNLTAKSTNVAVLLEFEAQTSNLGYEFIRLARMDDC